jgi:hypothetical protein
VTQLLNLECETCGEQLESENNATLIVFDGKENRYHYCSAECTFVHFLCYFMLMPDRVHSIRKLANKLGYNLKEKPKKKK